MMESLNPFPGLRPFQAEEDHLFFGRERQTDELLTRLREERFLAVVGSSGSGKSSLVRAGMIPALHRGVNADRRGAWKVLTSDGKGCGYPTSARDRRAGRLPSK